MRQLKKAASVVVHVRLMERNRYKYGRFFTLDTKDWRQIFDATKEMCEMAGYEFRTAGRKPKR